MSNYFNAFEMSPVPTPALDAVAPEPYRGIYGMPMFITVPATDLGASRDFWMQALGFIDLFSIPGRLTHLRRWAFQDVLLVPVEDPENAAATPAGNAESSALTVSFACVLSEIDSIAHATNSVRAGAAREPRHTPWNSVELEVVTPENVRVIFTAAKPLDPASQEARYLEQGGITEPPQ